MRHYLLWDHDGVLVDTEPLYFEATRRCIAALGVDLPLDGYLADMAAGRTAWDRARQRGASEADVRHHRARRDALYQQLLGEREIESPFV